MCYCCSDSDASSSTNNTNNTTNDTDSSDNDTKSKPWLSRMFNSNKSASADEQTVGDFNAAKHFDLKNVHQDFNKPPGDLPAPGARKSKSGRKIR